MESSNWGFQLMGSCPQEIYFRLFCLAYFFLFFLRVCYCGKQAGIQRADIASQNPDFIGGINRAFGGFVQPFHLFRGLGNLLDRNCHSSGKNQGTNQRNNRRTGQGNR